MYFFFSFYYFRFLPFVQMGCALGMARHGASHVGERDPGVKGRSCMVDGGIFSNRDYVSGMKHI